MNCSLKSCGDANDLPGMNEVSNQPLRRSTNPLDSGSRGGSSTNLVARVPMNAGTPSERCGPRPMPRSLSHNNRRGTRPSWWSNCHMPSSRSSVALVGIIRPRVNRENAAVITRTGNRVLVPFSSMILLGGNHRSHWAASPASHVSRSAGSTGRCSGRSRATFSRNQDTEPVQPTRSASTDAGMSGNSDNNSRTLGSNTANDVSAGLRAYFGGAWEATALTTVVREIPNLAAIRAFGTPSAASLLINAQSSKVITLHRG